jgi:hypothetical protein
LSGNAWAANHGGNSVTELNSSLAPVAAAYTGGGLSAPNSIAIDNVDNAWLTNAGNSNVPELSSTGVALSPSGGFVVVPSASQVGIVVNPVLRQNSIG